MINKLLFFLFFRITIIGIAIYLMIMIMIMKQYSCESVTMEDLHLDNLSDNNDTNNILYRLKDVQYTRVVIGVYIVVGVYYVLKIGYHLYIK